MNEDLNQQTIKTYNKISPQYARINFEPKFWFDEFSIFEKMIPGKKIINIGCGTGRDAVLFTKYGYDYLGLDASAGMLRIAKIKAPKAKFKKINFYSLKEKNFKNFDGFWASASLLHIPKNKVKAILKSLKETIKDDGAGFISIKPKLDKNDEQVVPDKRYKNAIRFFAYYKKSEFKKLLQESGFKVIKITEKLELPDNKLWLCFFLKK